MKLKRTRIYWIVAVVAVALGVAYVFARKNHPLVEIRGARTLYVGYVKIEPVSMKDLKTKLERLGCRSFGDTTKTDSPCNYQVLSVASDEKESIVIYPRGSGFGPVSFTVTEDRISTTKDIPGLPDPRKFQAEIREDVSFLGDLLRIKEDSWKITETTYPWTAIY